jgi:hypothetical protein
MKRALLFSRGLAQLHLPAQPTLMRGTTGALVAVDLFDKATAKVHCSVTSQAARRAGTASQAERAAAVCHGNLTSHRSALNLQQSSAPSWFAQLPALLDIDAIRSFP